MGKLLGPSTAIVPCENYRDKQTPRADFWLRLMARTREKTPNFPYMDPAPIATTLSFLNEIRLHPYIRSFAEAFTSPRTLMGFAHLDLTNLSAA